jgi:hypothetical protein
VIVFDLQCGGGQHLFEAWFSSSVGYEDQRKRGLVSCPICADTNVTKAIMAPNVGAKGNRGNIAASGAIVTNAADTAKGQELKAMLGKIAELQAASLKDSTWVGKDFEKQARAMDAGEVDQSSIHGQATPAQAKSMIEDGIALMPLLVPIVPPEERN